MSVLIDDRGKKRFDLRTEIRNPKTGEIVKKQPYKFKVCRDGDPQQWFERDGIKYSMAGEIIGGSDPKAVEAEKKKIENAVKLVEAKAMVKNTNHDIERDLI